MKKFLTSILVTFVILMIPIVAIAAAFTLLHQPVPIEWSSFTSEVDTTTNAEIPHLEDSNEVFWHFVANQLTDAQKPVLKATIVFKDKEGNEYTTILNSFKTSGDVNHYGIYTPYDYILINASIDDQIAGLFNLSHVYGKPTETIETTTPTTETTQPTETTTPTTTPTTIETTPTTTETTQPTTTPTTTTTETSGTTITTVTTTSPSTTPTPTTTTEIPQTGEVENIQSLTIGAVLLSLALALLVWKKRLGKSK